MTSLNRRPLFIALLAILAIGVAAATLNSAVVSEGAGSGVFGGAGDASDQGLGQNDGQGGNPFSIGFGEGLTGIPFLTLPCFPILNDPRVIALAAILSIVALYALYRQLGTLAPIGFFFAFFPIVVLVHSILTACGGQDFSGSSETGAAGNSTFSIGLSEAVGGGSGSGALPPVSTALLVILGIALVVAIGLLFRSSGDDVEPEPEPVEPETDAESMVAIGEAAGRAADRIEADAEADNEVYRAWREMTGYLDLSNPESTTPTEFAEAAIGIGMDPDDVNELTALFEEVRYGTADATADREEQAVAALRRIESAYAEGAE